MEKNKLSKYKIPHAYFITFTTYGNWLHYDERTSVDRKHNLYGTRKISPNKTHFLKIQSRLKYQPFIMNTQQRIKMLETIVSVCEYKSWRLFAANVRTNHVHIIIQSKEAPEYVMSKIKAYGSRNLNLLSPEDKERPFWTRHGSTIPVLAKDYFYFLMDYVVNQQGSKVACFYENWFDHFELTGIIPD